MRIAILALLAALTIGCATKASPTSTEVAQAVTASAQASKAPKTVHSCGAKTKAGGTCTRHVKAEGLRCWQHQGK
jgi:hypothetical protein